MRLAALLLGLTAAGGALAQTTNDDTSAAEGWWDRVGAGFFSESTLATPRPEYEIRAQWTALSADDQAALRARCTNGGETAPVRSLQEGDEDESPEASAGDLTDRVEADPEAGAGSQSVPTADETTLSGSYRGAEVQQASPSERPEPYTGLAGGVDEKTTELVLICDLIPRL